MGYFIDKLDGYYEGDKANADDVELIEQRPSPRHQWVDGAWITQPLTKDQLLAATRVEKSRRRDSGVTVNGVLFDTDYNARTAYNELAIQFMLNPGFVVEGWKASDGQWVNMDASLYQQLMSAGHKHIKACFEWQQAEEAKINAAIPA